MQVPSIGRTVHYTLSEQDADAINRRRADAPLPSNHPRDGRQVHVGNKVAAGQVYPLIITRVWGGEATSAVNGQVLLDGNDTYWAMSVTVGEGERHFVWPSIH